MTHPGLNNGALKEHSESSILVHWSFAKIDMGKRGQRMSDQLFAVIRRGKVKPGMANEFAKRVKARALPVMQKMDGFRGYYLVAAADDTVIAVSLFTNQQTAQTSTQTLMPWIEENRGPLLASPTEAVDGTVVVSA